MYIWQFNEEYILNITSRMVRDFVNHKLPLLISVTTFFPVIGRGGEQITRLQSETGCKIQMAAESGGLPERTCTLTGSREAVK
jgi:polyribonucleotide nucleotidyltransferase